MLVTGSGKGIGRAMAKYLAERGAVVHALSRNTDDLESLKRETADRQVHTHLGDIRDYARLSEVADIIRGEHGRLDLLIANAGADLENESVENSDVEKWQETVEINLIGTYKTIRSAIPLLKKSSNGKVILIGSGLGHRGLPNKSAYSVSKAGTWMLTRILAQELLEYGIAVNELIPGPVMTEIGRAVASADRIATVFTQEWNKTPEDLLPLLEFLLSQGPKGPTGQTFSLARRDLY